MRLLEVHAVGNYSAYNSKYPRQMSHYLSNRVAWNLKKRRYKYVPLFLDTHVVETVWYRWNPMGCDDPHSITDNSFIKTCGLSGTCQEAGEGLRRLISKFKHGIAESRLPGSLIPSSITLISGAHVPHLDIDGVFEFCLAIFTVLRLTSVPLRTMY